MDIIAIIAKYLWQVFGLASILFPLAAFALLGIVAARITNKQSR